jgi:hypothetical protein
MNPPPDLHLPPLTETAKQEAHSDSELLVPLGPAKLETLLEIRRLPEANLLAEATQLPWEAVGLAAVANRSLREKDPGLDLRQTEQRPVRARPLAAQVTLEASRFQWAERFPPRRVRAPRCLPSLGPCAFSPGILAARKCNRAARCGDLPIFARYHSPRNRRALAGCDNRCSRSRRKRARLVRTSPIAALDKYRCLLRRIAD